jgi:hypothetical protein
MKMTQEQAAYVQDAYHYALAAVGSADSGLPVGGGLGLPKTRAEAFERSRKRAAQAGLDLRAPVNPSMAYARRILAVAKDRGVDAFTGEFLK